MCLWVLVGHTCRQTGLSLPVLRSPHYAVDGFMILSGFLMAYHGLLRSDTEPWTKPSTWAAFYVRRWFRITPLYYLLLIPAYLFSASFLQWRASTDRLLGISRPLQHIQPFSLTNLFAHLTYVFGLAPSYHVSTVLPDWSLSLEIQFYLAFPAFMLLALRFGWATFSLTASAIWVFATTYTPRFAQSFVQPSPLPLSLLWFVIGMLWASAYLEREHQSALRKILLGTSLSLLSRDLHDVVLVSLFAWILFSERRLALLTRVELARTLLSGRVSHFLADASYSVYLTHLLILTPVAYELCSKSQLSISMRFLVAMTVTVAGSYGLAKPLELIENWGIAAGKRLGKRILQPTPRVERPFSVPEARVLTGSSFLPNSNPVDI